MLYEIDGKIYILASNKYREVKIEKDSKNGYDVKVVLDARPLERTFELRAKAKNITVEEAYDKKRKNKGIE